MRGLGFILGIACAVVLTVFIRIIVLKFALGLVGYAITYTQGFGIILVLDIVGRFFRRVSK